MFNLVVASVVILLLIKKLVPSVRFLKFFLHDELR